MCVSIGKLEVWFREVGVSIGWLEVCSIEVGVYRLVRGDGSHRLTSHL